jgi:hypothetical protein
MPIMSTHSAPDSENIEEASFSALLYKQGVVGSSPTPPTIFSTTYGAAKSHRAAQTPHIHPKVLRVLRTQRAPEGQRALAAVAL